jgi:uncharacterized membrane protein (Fun14 family)
MTQQTTPLAKAWTTTEGILVIVSDAVLGAGAAIDPHALSPKVAGIVVGVQHIALLAQRAVIKANALKQVQSVLTARNPVKAVEDTILADINASTTPGA